MTFEQRYSFTEYEGRWYAKDAEINDWIADKKTGYNKSWPTRKAAVEALRGPAWLEQIAGMDAQTLHEFIQFCGEKIHESGIRKAKLEAARAARAAAAGGTDAL